MASQFLTLCLFFFLISSASAYTFFLLEIEWPGTFCKQQKCQQSNSGSFDGKNFNIHGLWPSGEINNDCGYPSDCTKEDLDYEQISQLDVEYMETYWNSYYNDTPSFREHEWSKHGTCFDGTMNQYFSTVTALHKKYNPIKAMAKRNIFPNDEKTYSLSFIKQAIESDFNGPVVLKCTSVKGVQMLQKVDLFLSYDLETLTAPPCQKSYSGQCNASKSVILPVY